MQEANLSFPQEILLRRLHVTRKGLYPNLYACIDFKFLLDIVRGISSKLI